MNVVPKSAHKFNWKDALIVVFFLALIVFLATPLGPLGGFWRPAPDIPVSSATIIQKILFLGLNISESLTFGLGITFLIFGFPLVRVILPASQHLARAAHFSISWLLLNWWIHDSLHTQVGTALNGLLGIEYGFHFTLMLAGVMLVFFFLALMRQEKVVSLSRE
jgi:hypothetical protein